MSRIDSILSGSLVFRDQGTYLSEIRPGINKVGITGSLHVTGSNLLLNGKDLGNAILSLEAGQGADQVKFGSILLYTASLSEWTSSLKDYTSSLATTSSNTFIGTQTFSGSIIPDSGENRSGIYDLGSVEAPFRDLYLSTSSLHFVKDGQVVVDMTGEDNAIRVGNLLLGTSSIQIVNQSGSVVDTIYEVRLDEDGELVEVTQQSLPLGIVSSSAQIADLGFLSASINGIVSRSAQISELGFITGSKFSALDDIPSGIISSSVQIDEIFNLDGIISSSNQIASDISGSTTLLSSSIATRFDGINSLSGSSVIGSDLLNLHSITGSVNLTGSLALNNSDLELTGSLHLNFDGVSKYFSINVNGEEKVKVNEDGIFSLAAFTTTPTSVRGGLFFGDDDNLYLGVNE